MQTECNYLLKTLIIGDSGVGKSSLLSRLADNIFLENFMPTIGVDFRIQDLVIDNIKVKLQIWDTSGQDRFKSITSSYYRGAHCILVVFDITNRESFGSVHKWIDEVRKYAPNDVIMILIGNKSDNEDQRVITDEEGVDMSQHFHIQFFETSAKCNNNVETAFKAIIHQYVKSKTYGQNVDIPQKKSLQLGQVKQVPLDQSCFTKWFYK